MLKPRLGELWLADLEPRYGTEVGKTRPVLIAQDSGLTEDGHPSVIVFPVTTDLDIDTSPLNIRLPANRKTGLIEASEMLVDQPRAIDRRRLQKKIGSCPEILSELRHKLLVVTGLTRVK
jgi:mRNA interferase MazF